jgi:hypothetical protein
MPPLPAGMDAWEVHRIDGTEATAVSISDAAKLAGVRIRILEAWIDAGDLEVTFNARREKLVVIESLWAFLPQELKV